MDHIVHHASPSAIGQPYPAVPGNTYASAPLDPSIPDDAIVLPVGPRNAVTPASLRSIYWNRPGNECRAIKVKHVSRPGTRYNRGPFVKVVFECTPLTACILPSGPIMRDEAHVALTCLADAADPLWETLSASDQQRLHRTAAKAQLGWQA